MQVVVLLYMISFLFRVKVPRMQFWFSKVVILSFNHLLWVYLRKFLLCLVREGINRIDFCKDDLNMHTELLVKCFGR